MAVGFGIIGCGMIAGFHQKAIADIRGARVVACFDTFPSAAERFAAANHCTAYADLGEMLADPSLDVVTICTPSGAHLEPALAAAEAGKHVIVEKPLEITLRRCDQIIDACRRNRVTLATIFPSRFHESSRQLKKAIDAGRFGRLSMGDAYVKWYRTQEYYDSGAWRGTWKLDGGGALMNQAIHSVDLLTWLMGPVVEISAKIDMLAHKRIEVEDVAVATLRFSNGALGVIEATTAAYPGALKRIEIHGSGGSAVIEEEDIKTWDFARSARGDTKLLETMSGRTQTGGGAADPSAIGHHGHTLLFRDVLKAIKNGGQPSIDGHEGRRSVEIILGIYKAAETGRTIQLPLTKDPVLKARKTGVAS
ncbi:MAG: Gfo/Idh/MocA family oxidoreductase [Pirellulaceae bacterium]|nr:Gfo/Idh/MocA family oxidoreductase [Pirellulaceae bacterium]